MGTPINKDSNPHDGNLKIDVESFENLLKINHMILFIGHDASLTGAPKSLLLIIEHVSKNYKEQISIILKEGGPLEEEY